MSGQVQGELDHSAFRIAQFIRFRNPGLLPAVVTQTFMILASVLVVFGILYVLFVIILIAIHHYCYDRTAQKIPDYVKNSMQFSSDEDSEYDEEEMRALTAFQLRRSSTKSTTDVHFKEGPTNSKKTLLLDKFMHEYNDRQRNMQGTS